MDILAFPFMLQVPVMTSFATMDQTKFLSVMALVKYALLAHPRHIKSLHVYAKLDLWGVPAHVKVKLLLVTFVSLENKENNQLAKFS